MEGTRHEKILLVIMAYIIGFVTAYIAFSGTSIGSGDLLTSETQQDAIAEQANTTPPTHTPPPVNSEYDTVVKEEGGVFYVIVNGNEKRLSINLNENPQASSVIQTGFGGYYEPMVSAVSPSGAFVFYCERLQQGADDCVPSMYDVDKGLTYLVTNGDKQQLITSLEQEDVRWQPNDILIMGDHRSITAAAPWRVTRR